MSLHCTQLIPLVHAAKKALGLALSDSVEAWLWRSCRARSGLLEEKMNFLTQIEAEAKTRTPPRSLDDERPGRPATQTLTVGASGITNVEAARSHKTA